jgi:hypothetical protein
VIERDVKKNVKEIIKLIDPTADVFMPVQTGFGASDLDFIVTVKGVALRIETKVDRKQPSPRQNLRIAELVKAGAVVLVIDQHNLRHVKATVELLVSSLEGHAESARRYADDSREKYSERR